jgi:hypothetical protein
MSKPKYIIKLKKKKSFKEFVFDCIIGKVNGNYLLDSCTEWLGYKEDHKTYSVACYMVYLKSGTKHYINPQKYIYNYLNSPNATYGELIKMKNRVRNIDRCTNRGQCCNLNHLEEY